MNAAHTAARFDTLSEAATPARLDGVTRRREQGHGGQAWAYRHKAQHLPVPARVPSIA